MDSNVRPAKEYEVIDLLRSKGVLERLKSYPEHIRQGLLFIVNERMALILIPHSEQITEAHIAESRENIQFIHTDIDESLKFIQSLGYNQVYTNVRNELKTTLNLLIKHGFSAVDTVHSEVILLWASKQHS